MKSLVLGRFSLAIQKDRDIKDLLVPGTARGMVVYRSNYLYGHIQALENKYTSILKLLGMDNFKYFSKRFLARHPPSHENIDEYGSEFGAFLKDERELEHFSYIGDLARLDWFWFKIYTNLNTSIEFSEGVFSLWNCLVNDEEINNIEIYENKLEKVIAMENGDDVFLAVSLQTEDE